MKKIISMILAVLMMLSCAYAAPFVQVYDEMEEQDKTVKVIAEGDYVFALSNNSEIYVYDISDKNNIECIKTIYRDGFTVKDVEIANKQLIITYDSETQSHVTIIKPANIPAWNKNFTDFAQITAAECEIEVADKYVYFKSYAENKIYVCDWFRGNIRLRGNLGEEYMNMTASGKYMYIPEDDVTKVYDVSSDYSGTEVTQLPVTEIKKAVICGEYILIAKANEAKVFTSDFEEIYSYDAQGTIADIEISGENLWIYTSNEIQMLSTADIATELTLKSKTAVSKQSDIAAIGEYAFATAQAGIKVYRNLPYEITDAQYTAENGEVMYSANFENYTDGDITAEIYMLVLKDGKTVKTVKDTLNFAANSQTPVTVSVQADEECEIRTLIVDSLSNLNVLSAEYANERIVSYMKTHNSGTQKVEYKDEESIEISDADEYGNVTVCGVSAAKEGRALVVAVKYGDAVTYMNAAVARDESYGFEVKPSGYGTHEVTVNDGGNIYSGSFEVAAPKIEVGGLVEDMGRETYIIIKAQNMQNAEKVQLEMDYDETALEFEAVPEILSIMEGFEAESVSAADGTLSITLNKTDKLTTAEAEFLKIAVKTSATATEGTYTLAPDIQITDALGNTAAAQVTDGTLEIYAVIEKYDAIDAVAEVLKTVKADFDKAEYRAQKVIVADANAKIEDALSKGAREYDFDSTLMQNLKSAEKVLAKYEPEFNAIDAINAVAAADIDAEIGKYVKLLNINTALWDIYTASEIDKTDITTKLEACAFDLPENINTQLAEIIIPELIEKTQWSGMDKIITELSDTFGFADSRYDSLSSEARKSVGKELAEKTFADISEIKDALEAAIDAYYDKPKKSGNTGGGGTGGKVSSNVPFIAAQPAKELDSTKPESYKDTLIFTDLDNALWAKDAIEYLAKDGAVSGTGEDKFTPDGLVTREAFVKMLIGALKITSDIETEFTDVGKDAWYYTYINAAAGKGIVSGYTDGSFGVGKNITREEMAVIISRAVDFCGIILEDKNDRTIFDDNSEISGWAKESITAMQKAGIINGVSETQFAPKSNATRAQAAKLIYEIAKIKAKQGV